MVESRRHHPPGADLPHSPDPGPQYRLLDEPQRLGHRRLVRGLDGAPGRLVPQRPQHRRRFRDRKGQVVAGDLQVAADRLAGDRIAAVAKHRRQLALVDSRACREGRVHATQAVQAPAEPTTWRITGRRVVVRHRLPRHRGAVVHRNVPGQVPMTFPRNHLVNRQHDDLPPTEASEDTRPLPAGVHRRMRCTTACILTQPHTPSATGVQERANTRRTVKQTWQPKHRDLSTDSVGACAQTQASRSRGSPRADHAIASVLSRTDPQPGD